jgi:uncharacterized protein
MVLEGVVTNVAAFGAFVDVGVHQDGLVHVSAMSKAFVSDPRDVARSGEVVRVKVLEVDEARKRISLTLRLDDEPGAAKPDRSEQPGGRGGQRGRGTGGRPGGPGGQKGAQQGGQRGGERGGRSGTAGRGNDRGRSPAPAANNAMADALRRAGFDTGGGKGK